MASADAAPSDAAPSSAPTFTRELLSRHVCTGTFSGMEAGREPMLRIYPPQPAKQWAVFAIAEYEEYEKPGQYGDERQTRFAFVPAEAPGSQWADVVSSLQPNDRVKIAWRHEYVKRTEPGGMSSYPERPVTLLEKLDADPSLS